MTLRQPPFLRVAWVLALALVVVAGCGDDEPGDASFAAPAFPTGPGRLYPVTQVTFESIDNVRVAAFYGRVSGAGPHPTVILVHEVGTRLGAQEWLASGLFEDLLEDGFNALAINLRGHGGTPLPDDGRSQQLLLVSDLEDMHLDVRAGITWLRHEASADNGRLGVIGNGIGGNIAYVSMGAFPDDLQAAVALSPGFWDQDLQPLAIGAGISPFAPHSILYLVGAEDFGVISQTSLSYSAFASVLASVTEGPRLRVLAGVSDHGLDLLRSPGSVELILDWLQTHL